MIGKITFCRIEPCFMANKPACGDVSRVKKETNTQNISQVSQVKNEGVDTFTSSKDTENLGNETKETQKDTQKQG